MQTRGSRPEKARWRGQACQHLPRAPPKCPTMVRAALGMKRPPGPGEPLKEPLKGLSRVAATETSDLKMKVASLEGELKQQRESTQAMGEESRRGAWRREPCARRPDHQPPVSVSRASGAKLREPQRRLGLTGHTAG